MKEIVEIVDKKEIIYKIDDIYIKTLLRVIEASNTKDKGMFCQECGFSDTEKINM